MLVDEAAEEEARRSAASAGRESDEVVRLLYDTLHGLARDRLARWRSAPLDPTDLVHECFLRLAQLENFRYLGRAEFLALASRVLQQVLIDQARRERRSKRGEGWRRVTLAGLSLAEARNEVDLLELAEALERLRERDEGLARLVELRFLTGLTMKEIAALLGVTVRVLERDREFARAWLQRELGR